MLRDRWVPEDLEGDHRGAARRELCEILPRPVRVERNREGACGRFGAIPSDPAHATRR